MNHFGEFEVSTTVDNRTITITIKPIRRAHLDRNNFDFNALVAIYQRTQDELVGGPLGLIDRRGSLTIYNHNSDKSEWIQNRDLLIDPWNAEDIARLVSDMVQSNETLDFTDLDFVFTIFDLHEGDRVGAGKVGKADLNQVFSYKGFEESFSDQYGQIPCLAMACALFVKYPIKRQREQVSMKQVKKVAREIANRCGLTVECRIDQLETIVRFYPKFRALITSPNLIRAKCFTGELFEQSSDTVYMTNLPNYTMLIM